MMAPRLRFTLSGLPWEHFAVGISSRLEHFSHGSMEQPSMRVETRALEIARTFYEDRGFSVEDVSHKRGHNGNDFVVRDENQGLLIEVKGCSRLWGIPDLFATEFDDQHRLIADVLCVV
jgi:hypothetical protein